MPHNIYILYPVLFCECTADNVINLLHNVGAIFHILGIHLPDIILSLFFLKILYFTTDFSYAIVHNYYIIHLHICKFYAGK